MNEELIAKVVKQVLDDPRIQMLLRGHVEPQARPQMLILLNYAPDLPEQLQRMRDLWARAYSLKVLASPGVERCRPELPEGMEWVTFEEAYNGCWQRIVLPTCSHNTLAKIALGLRDTPISIMAAEGIMRGIPVELCTSQLKFTEKTPPAYRQLYEGYLKQVESYGVVVRESLCDVNSRRCAPVSGANSSECALPQGASSREVVSWERRLLTEKDVLNFPVGCAVRVGKATIISPLAMDTLKKRRIEILREGVS